MNKTTKYEMFVNTMYTSGIVVPISKKEFHRQIRYYKEEIAGNHEAYKDEIEGLKTRNPDYWRYTDIEGCLNDMRITTQEHEKYVETTYSVDDDGAGIVFRKRICKPGYFFKN